MKTPIEVLLAVDGGGGKLGITGDKLRMLLPADCPPELKEAIRQHKSTLLELLRLNFLIVRSETVNATLEFSLVMTRAIRDYLDRFGYKVGFKPAGGISSAKQAMAWQSLMKEELGDEWLKNDLFRIGASSLLTDIERQLYHYITGHYAAKHHMPMG